MRALAIIGTDNEESRAGSEHCKKIFQRYQSWRDEARINGKFAQSAQEKFQLLDTAMKDAKNYIRSIAPHLACYWLDDRSDNHPGDRQVETSLVPEASVGGQPTTNIESAECTSSNGQQTKDRDWNCHVVKFEIVLLLGVDSVGTYLDVIEYKRFRILVIPPRGAIVQNVP